MTFKEDKIVGCILLGDVKGRTEIINAIDKKIDIGEFKDSILKEEFDFKKLR